MLREINKLAKAPVDGTILYLIKGEKDLKHILLSPEESDYIKRMLENKQSLIYINRYEQFFIFVKADFSKEDYLVLEQLRGLGNNLVSVLNNHKIETLSIHDLSKSDGAAIALCEGIALGAYQFLRYFSDKSKANTIDKIDLFSEKASKDHVNELSILIKAVYNTKDLVNTPVFDMNAVQLSKEFEKLAEEAGISIRVLSKSEIIEEKMGSFLAVNYGSIDDPTFTIMHYKAKNAKNKKPIVLVGKGVVYDTGGLSLKPTPSSMDLMKSDMAGGACVANTIYAAALAKLPLNIIALIPATDNRPGGNAITPGDVVISRSGKSIEILNTDAEGRLILADALDWAKQYKPELVISVATLTGAASQALGKEAAAVMGNANDKSIEKLKDAGFDVFERLVEFPFWDDYGDRLKSDIADLKNIGGKTAGMITAGKFLEAFTDYPYIHLDIAGSAFLETADSYRGKGATGFGVRLLFRFLKKMAK